MPNILPHDIESEQALLGSILVNNKIYKAIELSYDDFYDKRNQKIYFCMAELMEDGLEIDHVTLWAKIKSKKLDKEINPAFLGGLSDETGYAGASQWESYVSIIKKKSAARKLIGLSYKLQKAAQNGLNDLTGKIESSMRELAEIKEKAEGKKKGITEQVRELVLTSKGLILTSEIHKELCLTSRDLKKQANEAIRRLADDGKVVPCGDRQGCYRIVEESEEIDWMGADIENIYKIRWPFEIEKFVTIYPGNIVILAGEKNAGKSAFLYNLIKLNQHTHKIIYFNSESGKEELKLRLSKFDDIQLQSWKFKALSRSGNFSEAIHPNKLNIIDYYEITDKFYQIGGEIKNIHDRLKKGICVIALQKDEKAEYGRGAAFSREKSRLYMTMSKGKLTIIDGKIWASDVNPNGMTIEYKLVNGAKFIEIGGSKWSLK